MVMARISDGYNFKFYKYLDTTTALMDQTKIRMSPTPGVLTIPPLFDESVVWAYGSMSKVVD